MLETEIYLDKVMFFIIIVSCFTQNRIRFVIKRYVDKMLTVKQSSKKLYY